MLDNRLSSLVVRSPSCPAQLPGLAVPPSYFAELSGLAVQLNCLAWFSGAGSPVPTVKLSYPARLSSASVRPGCPA